MNYKTDVFSVLLNSLYLENKEAYKDGVLNEISVDKETMSCTVNVTFPKVLKVDYERAFRQEIIRFFKDVQKYQDCKLNITYTDASIDDELLIEYYDYIYEAFKKLRPRYCVLNNFKKEITNNSIKFYCASESDEITLNSLIKNFEMAFGNYGLNVKIEVSISPFEVSVDQKIEQKKKQNEVDIINFQHKWDNMENGSSNEDSENKYRTRNKPRMKVGLNGKVFSIKELPTSEVDVIEYQQKHGDCEFVVVGELSGTNIKEITSKDKEKKYKIYNAVIVEGSASIMIKTFINEKNPKEEDFYKKDAVDGTIARVYGYVSYDKFEKDVVLQIKDMRIEGKASDEQKVEKSSDKRVELHAHTKMSALDGVMNVEDYVKRASELGYDTLAVTDHYNIQILPDFLEECKKYNIKPIFGVEGALVDENTFKIALTDGDYDLSDATFVVYDLETTGLSSNYDEIIEIAACKVRHGQIIDEFDEYVKPNRKIDEFITELTSITNDDVRLADPVDVVLPKFREFYKGSILVAHNATFDNSHIYANLKKLGLYEGLYPTIDTLQLARVCYGNKLKRFNLAAVCKFFDVELVQHHRAIYDASATANVFIKMLYDLLDGDVKNYNQINGLINNDEAYKLARPSHFCILSRNNVGKKNLYKIISDSHTGHFSREPRILKSFLNEHREGLLIGSGCSNGDVFTTAYEKSYDELLEVMKFYDYIEIQPLDLYDVIIEKANPEFMRDCIKKTVLTIIKAAKELGKLIVVTSDIHHLDKEDKVYREIYVNAPMIGGGKHPLAEMEEIPSFHFRTVDELMKDFEFLGHDEAYEYIVTNTLKIGEMIESYDLFPKGLFAPKDDFLADRGVPSIKEATIQMTYNNAKKIYGDPLPQIIQDRIDKELKSIIGNSFAPIYYIAYMLVKYSTEAGYIVGSRGSVGSSLVAYFMNITEVNSLAPHYYCPHCHFMAMKMTDEEKEKYPMDENQKKFDEVLQATGTGYDLPEAVCPICGEKLSQNGVNIPFETFLGFDGTKTPDIDLNFSGDFQAQAHEFCRTVFGEERAFRAGTIGTVAEKTAYGYAKGYTERKGVILRKSEIDRLAKNIQDVKRSTGQHPGGIVVIPKEIEYSDVVPVQYPADDTTAKWRTTHFDYHKFEHNLLKLDILGHDDPTMIRHLMNFVEKYPEEFPFKTVDDIPLSDKEVFKLFNGLDSLGLSPSDTFNQSIGTTGIPEFGTTLAKDMLSEIRPRTVDSLLKISGLSHGTGVWQGNARDFMLGKVQGFGKIPFEELIGCRDDIMVYLMEKNMPASDSFKIMETVRKKDKFLNEKQIAEMKEYGVPDWYIDSCNRIEYMFPKAHATAYVIMALRIGWFKVYRPIFYYAGFFSRRADAYDVEAMAGGFATIRAKLVELDEKMKNKTASVKEADLYNTLLLAIEMVSRGFSFEQMDINRSEAINFIINDDRKSLLIPFGALDSLGEATARSIVEARNDHPFTSKADVMRRTKINSTQFERLNSLGVFKDLPETDQIGLFGDL